MKIRAYENLFTRLFAPPVMMAQPPAVLPRHAR